MIRFFIFGLPVVLILLIAASVVEVSRLSMHKKNELAVGMLGEPASLNPILIQDSAGSEAASGIFNGLLKYDENLEITTDLAESYALSQKTTVFFVTPEAAAAGLSIIQANQSRWAAWKVTDVKQKDNAVVIALAEPGMQISREIFALFDFNTILPVHVLRLEAESGMEDFTRALRKMPEAQGVLREWHESAGAAELTIAGDPAALQKAAETVMAGKGKVTESDRSDFLAEPEIRFVLRSNVHWHDGAPFTSNDALFTYKALMDDMYVSPRKSDYLPILSAEAPDPLHFNVIYRKPFSPALGSWMMGLLPAHILEGKPLDWWTANFNRNPIGTGPYKFDAWKTNEYVRVVRNADYFQKPAPWLDSVVYRILPDQLTLRLAFETRQVDFWGVDPWAVTSFEHDKRLQLFSSAGNGYEYVGWNLRRPLFQDQRVRDALAYAVNIPEMIKYIIYGHGTQSTGVFTPDMWFFNPKVKAIPYDPEKAKALLAEAGWKPGKDGILEKDGQRFSFTLITNNANEIRRDICTLVQDNLRKLGIEAKIELFEWAVFIRNYINKGNFDATSLGWSLGPDYDQFQIWHSSQNHPDQLNVVSYNNPRVDELLKEIREEYNRDKIIALAGEIQEIIYHDQPYLFLYVPQGTSVIWKDSLRVRRPDGKGGWIDSPVQNTKAGWRYYMDWFYRPEYAGNLPK